jgi:hypothetical protein
VSFVGPFNITAVMERIKAAQLGFRDVAGAAEFDAAAKMPSPQTPAAFVLLAKEVAGAKQGGSSVHVQAVDVVFSVVIAARNYRQDQRGTAQSTDLQALITALRTCLVNWTPDGYAQITAVDAKGGQLASYDQATVWWMESFAVRYWIRTP